MANAVPTLLNSLAATILERVPWSDNHVTRPEDLDLAYRLFLARLIKAGPENGMSHTIALLLQQAGIHAAQGFLPITCLDYLRQELSRLDMGIVAAGYWQEGKPLWWHPLPGLSPLEVIWHELDGGLHLDRGSLQRDWVWLSDAVSVGFTGQVHAELIKAFGEDLLPLANAGVGNMGENRDIRGDQVAYLSGLETNLLERLPRLAVLIQWLRHRGAEELGIEALAAAPQNAMLARYPAPSQGYRPHLDNAGGDHENGRLFTLVVYLNDPGQPCEGGDLAIWPQGCTTDTEPENRIKPSGGGAVFFDARTVAHGVLPLKPGPARWALTLWFNRHGVVPAGAAFPLPELTASEAVLPVTQPPLKDRTILVHRLDAGGRDLGLQVWRKPDHSVTAGIVATVYRAHALLPGWCRYHLDLGFHHLYLVFDQSGEAEEQRLLNEIGRLFPRQQVTRIEGRRWRDDRWPWARPDEALRNHATRGGDLAAVCARQTLNATSVLGQIQAGALPEVQWLLHLDADERFHLAGDHRGGRELGKHFAALQAAGFNGATYLNHEVLAAQSPGTGRQYKINPLLAQARLGVRGWARLKTILAIDGERRLYFHGYHNGKSAVRVAAGDSAAGVHRWHVKGQSLEAPYFAGPFVLHDRFVDALQLYRKYSRHLEEGAEQRLFPPSPLELAINKRIQGLKQRDVEEAELIAALDSLLDEMTHFTADQRDLLASGGLLYVP